jgi:alanine dehydrogenase
MPKNIKTLMSNEYNIRRELPDTDLVVGAVLLPGRKAPKLITRDMLSLMQPGSVLVDISIDQGGCFETSRPSTHENPTYLVDEVIHYAVANIPGAVAMTSTKALTNATMPYVLQLANQGWIEACRQNAALRAGLNIVHSKVNHQE